MSSMGHDLGKTSQRIGIERLKPRSGSMAIEDVLESVMITLGE